MSQRSTAQHCHIDTPFCTIRKSHVTWNFAVPGPHSEEIRRCILLFLCTLGVGAEKDLSIFYGVPVVYPAYTAGNLPAVWQEPCEPRWSSSGLPCTHTMHSIPKLAPQASDTHSAMHAFSLTHTQASRSLDIAICTHFQKRKHLLRLEVSWGAQHERANLHLHRSTCGFWSKRNHLRGQSSHRRYIWSSQMLMVCQQQVLRKEIIWSPK